MSADLTIKTIQENGDIQTVEIFILKRGFILHRHCLTEDSTKAEMYGVERKFWNKFYTKQEIVITRKEVEKLLEVLTTYEDIQSKIKEQIVD